MHNLDTIEGITLARFTARPQDFRQLEAYECPYPGDVFERNGVAQYCTGPFHGSPTVEDMTARKGGRYMRRYASLA